MHQFGTMLQSFMARHMTDHLVQAVQYEGRGVPSVSVCVGGGVDITIDDSNKGNRRQPGGQSTLGPSPK